MKQLNLGKSILNKLSKNHRKHLIFSSNTDVGKTLVTTGLVRASLLELNNNTNPNVNEKSIVRYLKPLQAGGGHDEEFIQDNINDIKRLYNNHIPSTLECKTMYVWDTPQSPHWCCINENKPVLENDVIQNIKQYLTAYDNEHGHYNASTTFIETAGGVLSPGPSSPLHTMNRHAGLYKKDDNKSSSWGWSTQGDMYSSLGLPVIMIGDGYLGGISSTLSSLESLLLRGYDIDMIAIVDREGEADNISAVRDYISSRLYDTRSGSGKAILNDPMKDIVSIPSIPPPSQSLEHWFSREDVLETFHNINVRLNEKWIESIDYKEDMLKDGMKNIWWPFTQHATEELEHQKLIDRANGDYYSVITLPKETEDEQLENDKEYELEQRMIYDGPASWWTQGLGHGESSQAISIGAAAGRYGHVLFPSLLNEPSITLSKLLITNSNGPGYNWATRSFFSDDGSTAVEVAIKMALKLYSSRFPNNTNTNLTCMAHEDCYHGDTLGAMNIAIPSIFNEGQQPWYQSKGCFLNSPTIGFQNGKLIISFDDIVDETCAFEKYNKECCAIDDVYDINTRLKNQKDLYDMYRNHVCTKWDNYEKSNETPTIAFTFIEPLVLGAGGMKFIDPLYQRALLDESIKRNIPIVYDEIFTGLYRLGSDMSSSKNVLGINPDIACYSKLLTGGLVPLGITLASNEVFDCFLGDDKASALLHGHSYTAYPVGCTSAIHALETYNKYFKSNPNKIYFDQEDVWTLSTLPIIKESFALGTVLVIKVQPKDTEITSGGYGAKSSRTSDIIKSLWDHGVYSRPLGNVIYIMVSPLTDTKECDRLSNVLGDCIRQVMHEEHDDC